jgi:hypothetical protein
MPLLNDIHSILVPASQANFTAHTYTEVYAGADDTIAINGYPIKMGNGSSIKIKVKSISGGTNCILLGENINNMKDGPILL